MNYFLRRAWYDAVRDARRASDRAKRQKASQRAAKQRMTAMRQFDDHVTAVRIGDTVRWIHPKGFTVTAKVVDVQRFLQRVRIQVMRNGKPEVMWVKAESLRAKGKQVRL